MEADRLFGILKQLNIPVTNTAFPPNMVVYAPFIIFIRSEIDTFKADNSVYFDNDRYRIELYMTEKSTSLENQLKEILTGNDLIWNFLYDEITDEGLYITAFEV